MKMTSAGFLQIRQLGMLDFAVHLRERFLAAHGQHRMAQADEDGEQRDQVCAKWLPYSQPRRCLSSMILRGMGAGGRWPPRTNSV